MKKQNYREVICELDVERLRQDISTWARGKGLFKQRKKTKYGTSGNGGKDEV